MQRKESDIASFTFEELSAVFNQQAGDGSLFDCGNINLLKIFQHAIASEMQGVSAPVTLSFNRPLSYQNGIFVYRKWKRKELYSTGAKLADSLKPKEYLVYSGSNCLLDETGNLVSANTKRVLEELGRENCLYIYREYKGKSDPTGQDFNFSQLNYYAENRPLEAAEKKFFKALSECFERLSQSAEISPEVIPHLARHLQIFCNTFRVWYLVLSRCQPKCIYFSMHYHTEGLMAAAKMFGIPCVELQHGLISANDYYYVYSSQFEKVVDRALFADKILIFGEYWGRVLDQGCEYPANKRAIIGNYQYRPPVNESSLEKFGVKYRLKDRKVILIATQTGISEYYASYIHQLSPRLQEAHPEYVILIKPHPNQRDMHLLEACTSHPNVVMCEKTDDLMLALKFAAIQISLYSTTFYDALGTGTVNLSLYENEKYRKYAELMIAEQIALALKHDDDPVEVAERGNQNHEVLSREEVYATFNADFWKT